MENPPVDSSINNDEQRAAARAEFTAAKTRKPRVEKLIETLIAKGIITEKDLE